MRDRKEETIQLLIEIYKNFDSLIKSMPVEHEKLLNVVGYTGFRQGTQIDPIWNAYLLGLIVYIGDDIENARIIKSKDIIFSYRFKVNYSEKTIFDRDYGWLSYQKKSIEYAEKSKYVLACDISDFYPRIYHHRLENALKKATLQSDIINQIKFLLNRLSGGV